MRPRPTPKPNPDTIGYAITLSVILAPVLSTRGPGPAALMVAAGVAVIAGRWEFLSDPALSRPVDPAGAGPLVLPEPDRSPAGLARAPDDRRPSPLRVLARTAADPGFHGRAAALCVAYGLVSLLAAILQEMFSGSAEAAMRGLLVYWGAAVGFGTVGAWLAVRGSAKSKNPKPPPLKRGR